MAHRTDYQLSQILKTNRDGSPDRRRARYQSLMRVITHLQVQRGYPQRWDLHKIGKKEVSRLVHDWRAQGLAHRTIANYMVDMRWLADKVGRADAIPSNKDIGIGLRKHQPGYGDNKAVKPDWDKIRQLPERARLITELRIEFGLRTQEAVKFQYRYATQEPGKIQLKGSWTKGGRPRDIPITTEQQRELLERVGRFQSDRSERSMIPGDRTFAAYYAEYNRIRHDASIEGHAYRHYWAQQRFWDVSGGIAAPHADGPAYADLTDDEKQRWEQAAKVVNQELGHGEGREDITATYIGARL